MNITTIKTTTQTMGLLAGLALFAGAAHATVTPVAYYHLGEADVPVGVVAGAGNATTVDSVGGFNLSKNGSPTYATGLVTPLGMSVTAGNDYSNGAVATSATDNFGIEAFINLNSTAVGVPIYNGNGASSGFGLLTYDLGGGPQYYGLYGGLSFVPTGVAITTGQTVHLALVKSSGLTTMYVNGVATGTINAPGLGPNAAVGNITIGGGLDGRVDEARIFTFGAGQFTPNDLLVFQFVPEPSTMTLMGLGLATMFAAYKRRKQI